MHRNPITVCHVRLELGSPVATSCCSFRPVCALFRRPPCRLFLAPARRSLRYSVQVISLKQKNLHFKKCKLFKPTPRLELGSTVATSCCSFRPVFVRFRRLPCRLFLAPARRSLRYSVQVIALKTKNLASICKIFKPTPRLELSTCSLRGSCSTR